MDYTNFLQSWAISDKKKVKRKRKGRVGSRKRKTGSFRVDRVSGV